MTAAGAVDVPVVDAIAGAGDAVMAAVVGGIVVGAAGPVGVGTRSFGVWSLSG